MLTLVASFNCGGSWSRNFVIAFSGVSLKKGGSPSTISMTIIPKDQISTCNRGTITLFLKYKIIQCFSYNSTLILIKTKPLHNLNSKPNSSRKSGLQRHLSTPFRVCFTWSHGTQYPSSGHTLNLRRRHDVVDSSQDSSQRRRSFVVDSSPRRKSLVVDSSSCDVIWM